MSEVNVKTAIKILSEMLRIVSDFLSSVGQLEEKYSKIPHIFGPKSGSFWSEALGKELFKELSEEEVVKVIRAVYKLANLGDAWNLPSGDKLQVANVLSDYGKAMSKMSNK